MVSHNCVKKKINLFKVFKNVFPLHDRLLFCECKYIKKSDTNRHNIYLFTEIIYSIYKICTLNCYIRVNLFHGPISSPKKKNN